MNFKKILAVGLAATLMSSMLIGCAKKDDKTANTSKPGASTTKLEKASLKVWGSQDDQAMLRKMIEKFKTENDAADWVIELGVVGEPEAAKKYLEDPTAAADVFAFANDQLMDLTRAGGLYEVTKNKDAIIAANNEGSIDAATVKDKLYAYPMTADNGYFLYYDKSVVSAEDAKTLDGILAAANKANKKVFMDVSNGWYLASFFLGNGCKLGVDADGNQTCDFNSPAGVAVGEAIKAFTADKAFLTGDDSVLTGGFGSQIVAGVSGTWTADAIKEKLGDNYAAAKLPTFTVDGKQVQMGSFGGYKLIGVNSQTKYPLQAMALAEFLTNEENQLTRFNERAMGPSNIKVSDSAEVKANAALSALAEQNKFATSQKDVMGGFWNPAEAFGTTLENKDYAKSMKELVDAFVAGVVAPTK